MNEQPRSLDQQFSVEATGNAIRELLAQFRASAKTEREKGNYFERLAVDFIKNDAGMAQEYEDAWLFSDWAKTRAIDGRDTGIDAVAKIRGEASFCAIQCKFYREGHRIQKADIDSFFTASGKHQFSRRLIIDTTDAPWSANAEAALDGQDKPISRIGLDRLETSPIDWSAYLLRDEVKVAPPKQIRPHQAEALSAVRDGLSEADRGKLIMACGTGKTFTGLKIAEDMAGAAKMVLFLVPSLALASDEGKEVEGDAMPLECQLEHVDGTFNAKARNRLLDWLKEDHGNHACRILTNARCLSEGVDVPALDAILFMHPRKSQIDVVQAVGRVMRRAPGKNMGYVILPIGVPAGMTPEEALNDNERYRVVWQILNALRSHDERFDAMINKADLGVDVSDHIEVIAVSNKLPTKKDSASATPNIGHGSAADDDDRDPGNIKPVEPVQGSFFFDEFSKAIMAKIVKKCGRRDYWEDWASDIAKIAQTHIIRITALVEKSGTPERAAFEVFLAEIRDDLNDSINEGEAIEMLAQHIITRPVFEALFEGYSFAQHNPVSKAMQAVLETLHEHNLEKEAESLQSSMTA